jgi:hypothetical protein
VWTKQGREIKAVCRWNLQGIKLLPKSPLDSSPLGRGTGRGRCYFEESGDPKPGCSLKRAERKKGERKREADASDYATKRRSHFLMISMKLYFNKTKDDIPRKQEKY